MLRVINSDRFYKYLCMDLLINGERVSINTTHTAVKMFLNDLEDDEAKVNEIILRLLNYNEIEETFRNQNKLEEFAQKYVCSYAKCNFSERSC